jgi:winged helix DNA-binding protein
MTAFCHTARDERKEAAVARTAEATLDRRALNRALLARQHLLEREPCGVPAMIEHLVGMQAQVPTSPYAGLWSRIDGFDPDDLAGRFLDRSVVRMSLMRSTLHLVTAADAFALRPVVHPVLERHWAGGAFARAVSGIDIDELRAVGREILRASPLGTSELARRLAERWPDRDPMSLAYTVRFLEPLVQVPPRGVWGQTGAARFATIEAWLGRPMPGEGSVESFVLRYLGAFGPASVGDMRTWSWRTGLRPVFERLRSRLRVFRDERGRELFDLPDAPRPAPDTPAPVRFVPEYDNLLIGHDDRSRVIAHEYRASNSDRANEYRAFLVDGFVAGAWKLATARNGDPATLHLLPFRALGPAEAAEVGAEAARLLAFLAPGTGPREVVLGPVART